MTVISAQKRPILPLKTGGQQRARQTGTGCLNERASDKLTLLSIMKTLHQTNNLSCRIEAKNLTLGDLIASTYGACGE